MTLLLLSIRNLDEIEQRMGRVHAAAVTQQLAARLTELLPTGTAARFARAAFAVLFAPGEGDGRHAQASNAELIGQLARATVALREPFQDPRATSETEPAYEIDVVAGMAQCYADETAARFVQRANVGLARAVRSPDPSLVAMP